MDIDSEQEMVWVFGIGEEGEGKGRGWRLVGSTEGEKEKGRRRTTGKGGRVVAPKTKACKIQIRECNEV